MTPQQPDRLDTIKTELERRRTEHEGGQAWRRSLRRWFRRIVAGGALLSLALAGWFLVQFLRLNGDLIEGQIKGRLIPSLVGESVPVVIGKISGDLLHGVEIENLVIRNPRFETGGVFALVPHVSLRYSLWDAAFGSLILERVIVRDLTLTLSRDAKGVGLWDFGIASGSGKAEIQEPDERKRRALERQARTEQVADSFLQHIEFRNVSIMIPRPQELFLDSLFGRLLRVPRTTWQLSGLSLLLRKYPKPEFTDHVLTLEQVGRGTIASLQLSRTRSSGDYHVTIDGLGQNIVTAVQNRGQDGRAVQVFDGRNRERLNLRFLVSRSEGELWERIRGFSGNARFDHPEFLADLLPEGSNITGDVSLIASSPDEKAGLNDAEIGFRLANGNCILPQMPEIAGISLEFLLRRHIAEVTEFSCTFGGVPAKGSGTLDLTDPLKTGGSFTVDLGGEAMRVSASAHRQDEDHRTFHLAVGRDAGSLGMTFNQVRNGKRLEYRELDFVLEVLPGGRVSDLMPSRLLPPAAGKAWRSWTSRVDLIGPVRCSGYLPAADRMGEATATLDLDGATVVSRLNPNDHLRLGGTARIASRSAVLDRVRFALESLECSVSGKADFDLRGRKAEGYDLQVAGTLLEGKPFALPGARLSAALGLAAPLPFNNIVLEGQELFKATLSHRKEPQTVKIAARKIRLKQGRKAWWIDNLRFAATTHEPLDLCRGRPEDLVLALSGDLFGFSLTASAGLNLKAGMIEFLKAGMRGEDFAILLSALREMPFAKALATREQLDLGGAFRMEIEGKGKINRPSLSGSCHFSALRVKAKELEARLPFDLELSTSTEGEYQGHLSTNDAGFTIRGIPWKLEKANGNFAFGTSGRKDPVLSADLKAEVFGASVKTVARYFTRSGRFETLKASLQSSRIDTLASEVVRIGRFNLPFSLKGEFAADVSATGKPESMTGEGVFDFQHLDLGIPVQAKGGKPTRFELQDIGGRLLCKQDSPDHWTIDVGKIAGKVLGAAIGLTGKARLTKKNGGFIPALDGVKATFDGLSATALHAFLQNSILPEAGAPFKDVVGSLSGALSLAGERNRFGAEGEITLLGGGFRHSAIGNRVEAMSGTMVFTRRKDKPEPVVEVKNLQASYGRARFRMPRGHLTDPLGNGRISLTANAESMYPKEILGLLAGMDIPRLSFPKEGSFNGDVAVAGTLQRPIIDLKLEGGDLEMAYESDGNRWQLPIGKSRIALGYDLWAAKLTLKEGLLRFLGGEMKLDPAEALLTGNRPSRFAVGGAFDGINIGSLQSAKGAHVEGILQGSFKAASSETGNRDGELHLNFRNLKISNLPLDKETVEKIGLEFLEEPEFRIGQINLYLTSDGEIQERGRLRVADGLFAGPDLRIELGESAFDPRSLQLQGKAMFNPQPLRRTKLGRKLGSMTRVLQDRETGIPYLDLTVHGTWDKPELMGKAVVAKAKARGKRNFIKSIFGGRRSHKASVEELKAWFPGWEPNR